MNEIQTIGLILIMISVVFLLLISLFIIYKKIKKLIKEKRVEVIDVFKKGMLKAKGYK